LRENASMVGLLKSAGFTREGILRDHVSRNDKLHNVVVLGVLSRDLK
jgi:RimJ/RimL family protein N-acetyltransferase